MHQANHITITRPDTNQHTLPCAQVVYAGTHQLVFSRGHGQDVTFTITISSDSQVAA